MTTPNETPTPKRCPKCGAESSVEAEGNTSNRIFYACGTYETASRVRTSDLCDARSELAETKAAGGFCEKHKPDGGHRNCLVCRCEQLTYALGKVCAAIEKPGEEDITSYAINYDEEAVVNQVVKLVAERDELRAKLHQANMEWQEEKKRALEEKDARIAELERELADTKAWFKSAQKVGKEAVMDLQQQLAEARKDSERLDWLDAEKRETILHPKCGGWEVEIVETNDDVSSSTYADDLRTAIDNAK